MQTNFRQRVENHCGVRLRQVEYLPGGCVGEVWKVTLEDNSCLVVKTAMAGATLDIEGYMLRYLATHSPLPLPEVLESTPDLLLLSWIDNDRRMTGKVEEDAADSLAALHAITAPRFGHERDTLIGPLPQPNPWSESWIDFFREHRLLYMGQVAHEKGNLSTDILQQLERLCTRLEDWLHEPPAASLIHGDVWGGNVLSHNGRIAAFIDPAIYHAAPEIELAYTTLFSTFGNRFFARYREHHSIAPDFFEERLPLYHLYPLLVHAALFGGGYGAQVKGILKSYVSL